MNFPYDDHGKLITEAMADEAMVSKASQVAGDYPWDSGVRLDNNREFDIYQFIIIIS